MNPDQNTPADSQPATEARKARRWGRFATIISYTAVAASALGVGAALAVALTEPVVVTETKTNTVEVPADFPTVCGSAYKLAEEALLRYEDLGPLSSRAIDAVDSRNSMALDTVTSEVQTLNTDIQDTLKGYFLAKFTCEDQLGIDLPAEPTNSALS